MAGLGFPSRFKLKKTDEFSSDFNFRKRITGTILTVHYMPNMFGYARVGLVVGKKIARKSVHRNYMKRVLRDLFRHEHDALGQVDILIRPVKEFSHVDFKNVHAEFNLLMAKLIKKNGS